MRDFIEHRKIAFQQKFLELDFQRSMNMCESVDSAANCLQPELHCLTEQCFPTKTVRMFSRDPPWLSSLVKVLLMKKARLQARGADGLI